MNIDMFDFELPHERIAQEPLKTRHASKMMVIDRLNDKILHRSFCDILEYLNHGDVLVLNNTRVFPARIKGFNYDTGGKIEFLLVNNRGNDLWEVMCKPGKRAGLGKKFSFGNGTLLAEVIEIKSNANRIVQFRYNEGDFYEILNSIGEMPIPPYIHKKLYDAESYQTVYSNIVGSIAAPTAGLHFTDELLCNIKNKGVEIVYITLHVGLGTFTPVKVSNLEDHVMHSEYYEVSRETADIINLAKHYGRRVIAVGTTTVRTLETVSHIDMGGICKVCKSTGYTDIFIKPGYKFKIVDSIITNFHLPKSTLIVLISAFYNREKIIDAYKEAILNEYRFFSFGDSMFII